MGPCRKEIFFQKVFYRGLETNISTTLKNN